MRAAVIEIVRLQEELDAANRKLREIERAQRNTALVQIVGTSKHSLLRHADFRPEAPRSRLQVQLGLGRPDVLV